MNGSMFLSKTYTSFFFSPTITYHTSPERNTQLKAALMSVSVLPMNIQLISFRIDWFDLLAVQGTLKSLLQHHSSKTLVLWRLAFFIVQLSLTLGLNSESYVVREICHFFFELPESTKHSA